jgi:hypothetical protein
VSARGKHLLLREIDGGSDLESLDPVEHGLALAVPGMLSLPRATPPVPRLVLLSGSGIVVLRFDKVTYAHPEQVKANRDFIAADEYLPHALAAIQSLRNHPAIDQKRVFLAGHSLGGTVAPRVAATEPSLAGTVIRVGGTKPLH